MTHSTKALMMSTHHEIYVHIHYSRFSINAHVCIAPLLYSFTFITQPVLSVCCIVTCVCTHVAGYEWGSRIASGAAGSLLDNDRGCWSIWARAWHDLHRHYLSSFAHFFVSFISFLSFVCLDLEVLASSLRFCWLLLWFFACYTQLSEIFVESLGRLDGALYTSCEWDAYEKWLNRARQTRFTELSYIRM